MLLFMPRLVLQLPRLQALQVCCGVNSWRAGKAATALCQQLCRLAALLLLQLLVGLLPRSC